MAVGIPAIYGIFTRGLFAGWDIAKTVYLYNKWKQSSENERTITDVQIQQAFKKDKYKEILKFCNKNGVGIENIRSMPPGDMSLRGILTKGFRLAKSDSATQKIALHPLAMLLPATFLKIILVHWL